jgi:hypothetical protein
MRAEAAPSLPEARGLNVGALAGLFRHTTNSYKFLFFLALLERLRRQSFRAEPPITFEALTVEMLTLAWYPHTYFKLSFGSQDTIGQKLDALALEAGRAARGEDRAAVRAALAEVDLGAARRLMDFVPYRLLSPFLVAELRGVDKGAWMALEKALPAIANAHFEARRPLYRFDADDHRRCSALRVHSDWAAYLGEHVEIVRGWAAWHWLHFMQRRNPATPGLANKLFPPERRRGLTHQTTYWRTVLAQPEGAALCCIYSGEPLVGAVIALDHYLPWSFVVHDQLWNLVPVVPAVNSAKSNRLPDARYLEPFMRFQHRGLEIAQAVLPARTFGGYAEAFIADLHLPDEAALLDYGQLEAAYQRHLPPLLSLAGNQGFVGAWRV